MIEAPVQVPVETVTPIKPSEAIRLGCLIAPKQIEGDLFDGKGGACVLGALLLGYNPTRSQRNGELGYTQAEKYLPAHLQHPDRDKAQEAGEVLWELNDWGWSREEIADWLEEQGL